MNALLNYPGAKWGMAKEIVNSDPRTEVLWCNFETPKQFDLLEQEDM